MIFGYIRVSSKEQNTARQLVEMLNLGIREDNIHIDKESGKSFDRPEYKKLKMRLRSGDLLYIKSIDRFGRNYKEIKSEWEELTKIKGIDIKVIDMEILDTTQYKDVLGTLISDIILQVLAFVAERERDNIRNSQREGIEKARLRNVKFGRPRVAKPVNFEEIYNKWKAREFTAVTAMNMLKLSKTKFYKLVKEHEGRV